jgi:hypothetical protein
MAMQRHQAQGWNRSGYHKRQRHYELSKFLINWTLLPSHCLPVSMKLKAYEKRYINHPTAKPIPVNITAIARVMRQAAPKLVRD